MSCDERVMVFIDSQNLTNQFWEYQKQNNIQGRRIDFQKMADSLAGTRALKRVYYYGSLPHYNTEEERDQVDRQHRFHRSLGYRGFTTCIIPLKERTFEKMLSFIKDEVEENNFLEFKRSNSLSRDAHARKELSKDVSAFANAGGGLIIYGIKEEGGTAKELDEGVDSSMITKEWIEQIINSLIHPKIPDIRIYSISSDIKKMMYYIIEIPQSILAPHMSGYNKYYTRKNFSSIPMEDYEVRDVMMRTKAPDLCIELFFRRHGAKIEKFPLSLKNSETDHGLEMNGVIRNIGGGEVHHAIITLIFDSRFRPHTHNKSIEFRELQFELEDGFANILKTDVYWGGKDYFPLFKSVEFSLLGEEINIQFKSPWLIEDQSPFIIWEIKAPGMIPKSGLYRLRLDGNEIFFSSENLFEYKRILQHATRESQKFPDLSFKIS